MGVERDEAVKGMDRYDAVKLWGYAQNGSSEALDLLKLYNREDTVNLFGIAEVIYQRLRAADRHRRVSQIKYLCCLEFYPHIFVGLLTLTAAFFYLV